MTFILLIGRILRLSTTGLAERITYLELPYVDNILQLCLDVYLVREMHEFRLEEDLYAKLIFVYRSSETRIKWTRLPKDLIITDAKKNDWSDLSWLNYRLDTGQISIVKNDIEYY